MSIITVGDLIEELSKCDQTLPVNVYCEDETYWLRDIDTSMTSRVDINCMDENRLMSDKCKECPDGEMVLKIEDEEFQYRGKPLVVSIPYHECNSCGFDVVSYELMVEGDVNVKEAKRKADAMEKSE